MSKLKWFKFTGRLVGEAHGTVQAMSKEDAIAKLDNSQWYDYEPEYDIEYVYPDSIEEIEGQ